MRNSIRKIVALLLAALCLISVGKVLSQWAAQGEGDDSYRNAAMIAQSATAAPTAAPSETEPAAETQPATEPMELPTEPPEPVWIPAPVEEDSNFAYLSTIDLAALRAVNPDVVGWIHIPNTQVNYPLMQGEDNQFYLEHTWEGSENPYGSIFLEWRNSPDLTDFNTILYGHNMSNGSMFGDLSRFEYQWFWQWNRYIYLVTDEGILRYEIFACYPADVQSDTYRIRFSGLEDREAFLAMALENSQIDTGITPAPTDRIITLSTCTGLGYESRRVIHAYLKMIPSE